VALIALSLSTAAVRFTHCNRNWYGSYVSLAHSISRH